MKTRQVHRVQSVFWLLIIPAVLYLVLHAYLGSYSRYLADDFCTAGDVLKLGFWGAQSNLYMTWSGRFSFTFIVALTHLIGPGLTPILPALATLLWLGALTFLFFQIVSRLTLVRSTTASLLLASMFLSILFTASPNIYQSLYWQTGMLTYAFPLVLGTGYLGWLFKQSNMTLDTSKRIAGYSIGFLWPLFMGGFSETIVSVQTSGLLLAFIIFAMLQRSSTPHLRKVVLIGILGSIAAMLIVVLAPGNEIRRSMMPPSPDVQTLIKATLTDWYIFSVRTLKWHPLGIGLSFAVPFISGVFLTTIAGKAGIESEGSQRSTVFWILIIPMLTFLLMCASIAPYEYAVSSFPDARVLITTLFFCILGIGSWGLVLGTGFPVRNLRPARWLPALQVVLSVLSFITFLIFGWRASIDAVAELETMKSYAAAWDKRDLNLRSAAAGSVNSIQAASLTHMGGGLAEIGYDPDEWINVCVARTYGFDRVIAK